MVTLLTSQTSSVVEHIESTSIPSNNTASMASPSSPTQSDTRTGRRRTSSVTRSIASVAEYAEDLVLHHDPPPGFVAATAVATARAPSVREIRSGSLGRDGSIGSPRTRRSGSRSRRRSKESKEQPEVSRDSHGFLEPFPPVTEETTRASTRPGLATPQREDRDGYLAAADDISRGQTPIDIPETTPLSKPDYDRIRHAPPAQLPWTTSMLIGLKAFWKWFLTPFGFLLTLYGLNVVAWGGMLFLLLCNASPAMCHAPVHTPENRKHMPPAAALSLPGPYYYNCNDINSPRRIWIEIDSQILNALFCVTGFGLAPWRFRDLYYLLRYRFASEKKQGLIAKLYGLRILAGIYKSWFRLPGFDTLATISTSDYLSNIAKATTQPLDLESSSQENDPRVALPISKTPAPPPTGIYAPPTKTWKLDFFVWSQVWNTFFQCCLCGFMWGMDRYSRPSWSTGLFVALACIIAGAGGIVSYLEGKKVKKIEGVPPKSDTSEELEVVRTNATGHESLHLGQKVKDGIERR